MTIAPKGFEYWIPTEDGYIIREDAPEWAKKEFEEIDKMFEEMNNEGGDKIRYI